MKLKCLFWDDEKDTIGRYKKWIENAWLGTNPNIEIQVDSFTEFEVVGKVLDEKAKDRKSTRLNSSHTDISRMPSSA